MPTPSDTALSVTTLSQQDILGLNLICGTSGRLVRWIVGLFAVVFGALIYFLVLSKPDVSVTIKMICVGLLTIALVALLINGRMKIGWPAILYDDQCLYVTYDPMNDEFLRIPFALLAGCEKKMLFPNTMAVSVKLQIEMLSEQCTDLLKKAIYPSEDAVHVHSAFNSRSRIVAEVKALMPEQMPNVSTQSCDDFDEDD